MKGPLHGIRVIDLTSVVAGPYCTMMLGDFGADVLKIEHPGRGDDSRAWPPAIDGIGSFYLSVNRSKKSVEFDIKSPEGAAALRTLVASADVLVENFRPGRLSELGFGYADVSAINPRLIYCSITGYGQTGPCARRPCYDVVIQGETGIMDMTGSADGEPTRVGVAISDYLAALYASQGILTALYERMESGRGQHVDVALFDSMLSTMRLPVSVLFATQSTPTRVGNDHLSLAPFEPLSARDGLIIVAIANPRLWVRFCRALERPDLLENESFAANTDRVRNRAALKRELEATLRQFTIDELGERLNRYDVPWGRVRNTREVLDHPQIAARQMLITHADEALGAIQTLAPVVRLSRTPAVVTLPPPRLGQHTGEVLSQLSSLAAASATSPGLTPR